MQNGDRIQAVRQRGRPFTQWLPWYKKREELRVSRERLAKIVGKHPSYIEEIYSGRSALKWEENGELIWARIRTKGNSCE